MPFLSEGAAPAGFCTHELLAEPLRTHHVELDYAAVMETREVLRRWSLSTWPADDFTLNENLLDLEMHQREHDEGVAFTYTVLTPDRSICLGCVYVKPLAPLFEREHEAATATHPQNGARVAFWVRESRRADHLDRRLLKELMDWFGRDWSCDAIVFFTSDLETQQHRLFQQAGLRRLYMKPLRGEGGPAGQYVVFGSLG